MGAPFTAEERRRIAQAAEAGEPLRCPVCDTVLARHPIEPSRRLAYVRRRLWVVCPGCGRAAVLDVRAGGQS